MQPPANNAAPQSQLVIAPLTTSAIFLVVTIHVGERGDAAMRAMGEDLGALVRSVEFRGLDGNLSCVMGIGSEAWDRIVASAPPRHRHGFRYFDARDLLGFVDGTENPVGPAMADAAIVGEEDLDYAGGSYVIVQKYVHDLDAWHALSVEEQEKVIGRTKLEDFELDDDVKPANAHNALNNIEIDGKEVAIVRDNMPFGSAAEAVFGTYFIGYARDPSVTEQMLQNMFVGRPEGNYDRILDFSTAVTGSLFFAPSLPLLESLSKITAAAAESGAARASVTATADPAG